MSDSIIERRAFVNGRGIRDSYLEAQDLGLDEGERSSVDLDETAASLEISRHVSFSGSFSHLFLEISRTLQ